MSGTVQAMVDGFCKAVDEDVGASTISVDVARWFSEVSYRDEVFDLLPGDVKRRLGMSAVSLYFGAKAVG